MLNPYDMSYTFELMNFSFIDIWPVWLGLLKKCLYFSDSNDLLKHCILCFVKLWNEKVRWLNFFFSSLCYFFLASMNLDHCYHYLIGISSACTVLFASNNPSHIEFTKAFPRAWNMEMTDGSQTFTSSVKDLT